MRTRLSYGYAPARQMFRERWQLEVARGGIRMGAGSYLRCDRKALPLLLRILLPIVPACPCSGPFCSRVPQGGTCQPGRLRELPEEVDTGMSRTKGCAYCLV